MKHAVKSHADPFLWEEDFGNLVSVIVMGCVALPSRQADVI